MLIEEPDGTSRERAIRGLLMLFNTDAEVRMLVTPQRRIEVQGLAFPNIPAVKWRFRFQIHMDLLGFKPQYWVHNFTLLPQLSCTFVHRDAEARISLQSENFCP